MTLVIRIYTVLQSSNHLQKTTYRHVAKFKIHIFIPYLGPLFWTVLKKASLKRLLCAENEYRITETWSELWVVCITEFLCIEIFQYQRKTEVFSESSKLFIAFINIFHGSTKCTSYSTILYNTTAGIQRRICFSKTIVLYATKNV